MISSRYSFVLALVFAVVASTPVTLDTSVRDEEMKWCKGVPEKVKMGDDCDDAKKKWDEHVEKTKKCPHMPYRVDKGSSCIEELALYNKAQEEERDKKSEERAKVIEEGMKPYESGEMTVPMPAVSKCSAAKKMSDLQLYMATTGGRKVGSCYIHVRPEEFAICHMYVKAGRPRKHGNGYPRMRYTDGTMGGDGCVHDRVGPKGHDQLCWYRLSSFNLSQKQEWDICTPYGMVNAVNQIRMALKAGMCC